MCICNYDGVLADHLRASKPCVDALRRKPILQMKASDEVFIVKAAIILTESSSPQCPALGCPGGPHRKWPETCIKWWRETGWCLMGWKGEGANAEGGAVKEKISRLRRSSKHRNNESSQLRSQDATQDSQAQGSQHSHAVTTTQATIDEQYCQFCSYGGALVPHLHQSKACLAAYLQQHLPNRQHIYRGKENLAVFDLGLVCLLCPNPSCMGTSTLASEGVKRHLEGLCLQFYQREGRTLLGWGQDLTAASIQLKIRDRRSSLKKLIRDGSTAAYREELERTMKRVCSKCLIRGPLLGSQVHNIEGNGNCLNFGGVRWLCSKCSSDDAMHQETVRHAQQMVTEMGTRGEHDDTLKQVLLQVRDNERSRVVFVPTSLIPHHESVIIADEQLDPKTTTVLVPKFPEALEQVGDEALERANQKKKKLEKVAEFFGRRHFYAPVTETMSVNYQCVLARIRLERLSMLSNKKKKGKGKILSRDPPMADVKDCKPHYAETLSFCLTNTCSWSPLASEKRSNESRARAAVNGQVKLKVKVTLLKSLAVDSPILRDIILSSTHGNHPSPLISQAPLVLNYLKVKSKLLVNHVIRPLFNNWDLDLRFAEQEWTVKLVGYLYCEEFKDLNQRIARGEVLQRELASEVGRHPQILPTTAVSAARLEESGVDCERAQV